MTTANHHGVPLLPDADERRLAGLYGLLVDLRARTCVPVELLLRGIVDGTAPVAGPLVTTSAPLAAAIKAWKARRPDLFVRLFELARDVDRRAAMSGAAILERSKRGWPEDVMTWPDLPGLPGPSELAAFAGLPGAPRFDGWIAEVHHADRMSPVLGRPAAGGEHEADLLAFVQLVATMTLWAVDRYVGGGRDRR